MGLMKIQCRKSCGYCVPGQRDVIEEAQKAKNSTETKSTVDTDAPPADAKADAKPDAKADAKADAKTAKTSDSAKNETEGTKKSTTPTAKPLTEAEQKSKIAETESGSTNE